MMSSIARRSVASSKIKTVLFRSFASKTEIEHLLVNSVGKDRPGIVSDITKLVVDQGGNVSSSTASRLGSHFGLMMLVAVPKSASDDFQSAVTAVPDLSTTCYLTDNPDAVEVSPEVGYAGEFVLQGADNPGIVHQVTQILAKHNLNIDEMKTLEDKSAPYGGLSLFHMSGIATSPAPLAKSFDSKIVAQELEELGDRLNCDITLEDVMDGEDSDEFTA